jgi:hypothetical protein
MLLGDDLREFPGCEGKIKPVDLARSQHSVDRYPFLESAKAFCWIVRGGCLEPYGVVECRLRRERPVMEEKRDEEKQHKAAKRRPAPAGTGWRT